MPPYHLVLYSLEGGRYLLERCGFTILFTHHMPKNWYFSASVARKLGISLEAISESIELQSLLKEIDAIFDFIALKQKKSSSVQIIARKV